jgi:hypothetical protein
MHMDIYYKIKEKEYQILKIYLFYLNKKIFILRKSFRKRYPNKIQS